MKYRIYRHYERGFIVKQSRFGVFWGIALFCKEGGPFIFNNVSNANKAVLRLKGTEKPIVKY